MIGMRIWGDRQALRWRGAAEGMSGGGGAAAAPAAAAAATARLHLVSWNVAGWRTTLEALTRDTRRAPAAPGASAAAARQHALREWLARLGADVVCLQETKLPRGARIS